MVLADLLYQSQQKTTQQCQKGFEGEKDGNRGKFIGSSLVIFCYKEFEKFALYKSVSQSEDTFIIYSEPIESGHAKVSFS